MFGPTGAVASGQREWTSAGDNECNERVLRGSERDSTVGLFSGDEGCGRLGGPGAFNLHIGVDARAGTQLGLDNQQAGMAAAVSQKHQTFCKVAPTDATAIWRLAIQGKRQAREEDMQHSNKADHLGFARSWGIRRR